MTSARAAGRRLVTAILALLPALLAAQEAAPSGSDPWARLPDILDRITPPAFPDRRCPVEGRGCRADGASDCTAAFARAIDECSRAGGGHVIAPRGEVLTGAIHLLSNVDLHVPAGSTIHFSRDPSRYLPVVFTRWEGVELMNYSPLVYAFEAENVAVTGEGVLDGGGDAQHWWPWAGAGARPNQKADRERLMRQAEDGVPVEERVYGAGHYLRPPFIQTYRSRNVLIEGVTIRSSPFWVIHPVLSANVIVRGVTIESLGPNNDGCDPESSTDVLIEDSVFDTGDDCIAIKSGRNADGRRLATPSRNVVVRRCRMRAGHGGVTIGSEMTGGIRGVYVERCSMSSPDLDRGLRIKTNARRGGVVENVFLRDVEIGQVRHAAIEVDMRYEEGDNGPYVPVVRNVRVERMSVGKAAYALWVMALDRSPVQGLLVRASRFLGVEEGSRIDGVRGLVLDDVTIVPARDREDPP